MSTPPTNQVADLLKQHGGNLVARMAFFDKALKEWGLKAHEHLTTPNSMLDYLVAESADMMTDVEDGCVETFWSEQDSETLEGYLYKVPFQPSRNLEDALWASRMAGHGFCDDVTDPLDVCALILGRL